MAARQQLIPRPPHQVWKVLADGSSYARWVVGTQQILDVDPDWPAVGAVLRFQLGLGPLNFRDTCTVRICEPERRLELEAKAEPFGTARIAFTLIPWADGTLVILDEHPLLGPGARLQGPPSELLLHVRNRRMLGNLARVAVGESD
ncbi:MAG TPA: SRPBCC family protein [Actinocrinis sp.]|nr:SRPBCC family protein [Actinocrinis sp.]